MKKYANQAAPQQGNEYDGFVDQDISEQQLLPDVHDPNLWIAKVAFIRIFFEQFF